MDIAEIQEKINKGKYEFRRHALERANLRKINPLDIKHALLNGEIIEEYPNDSRGSSCLLWGKGRQGENIHVVCGLSYDTLLIISVYIPNKRNWVNPKTRRLQK